jgi:demethylmenaquinone methyltransferase/2-methoxy-6-polyprenyl-1,4-benzoquinol methylase
LTDISKSPDRIACMFDAIAARYDLLNHVLSGGIDTRWRKRAIASLRLSGNERVLDLCTGTGDLAIAGVLARPGAARVVGVDFASAMLRVGLDKLVRRGLTRRVALVRGDATRIPVASASVDAVTIGFGIRNVERVGEAFDEMRRVLKPGGRLAILEFAMPDESRMSGLYRWYITSVLPRIGRAVSRHQAAYDYLPASIDAFSAPAELVKRVQQSGFSDVQAVPLTFGTVILYTARRGLGG